MGMERQITSSRDANVTRVEAHRKDRKSDGRTDSNS